MLEVVAHRGFRVVLVSSDNRVDNRLVFRGRVLSETVLEVQPVEVNVGAEAHDGVGQQAIRRRFCYRSMECSIALREQSIASEGRFGVT